MSPRAADALVVFGITGDLARKMTFKSLYRLEQRGLLNCPVIGVAVDDWSVEQLRAHARESIEASGEPLDEQVVARFAARLDYVSGDFADDRTFAKLADALRERPNPAFYLEDNLKTLIVVQPIERSVGFPTVRLEVTFGS